MGTIIQFFQDHCKRLQLEILGKPVFCCTLWRIPDVCTHGHLPPSLSCRVIGTCTAYLFFPDLVRGKTTFPRTNRWETKICKEEPKHEEESVVSSAELMPAADPATHGCFRG